MVNQPVRLSICSVLPFSRSHACWTTSCAASASPRIPAATRCKGRWRHPIKSMGWYNDVKKWFTALPEGATGNP